MNLIDMIKERQLPPILGVEEMKQILQENEYGFLPDMEYSVSISEPVKVEGRLCAYTVEHSCVNITITTAYGSHTFPVHRLLHNNGGLRPFFVFLNFRPNVPDLYYPTEEIAESGFDVLSFCYTDVTSDDGDFSNGLAKILLPFGQNTDTTCGKIVLWAWVAMRVMDYAETLPMLDLSQAAVVGHSRLGKTALVASMLDQRFRYAFSSGSGCSGAALARGNSGITGKAGERGTTGETISVITKHYPYWFCPRFINYAEKNIPPNFDQHYLLASIAPRYAYVSSGSMDDWADPISEFLACVAASGAYENLGYQGLVHQDRLPESEETYHEGRIGYHKHYGAHFLSRHDWIHFMEYIRLHQKNDETVIESKK